jgi:hypothetical protein
MFTSAIVRLFHRRFDPYLDQVQDLAIGDLSRDNLDENGATIWMRRGSRAER